jgi:hypothetical protein
VVDLSPLHFRRETGSLPRSRIRLGIPIRAVVVKRVTRITRLISLEARSEDTRSKPARRSEALDLIEPYRPLVGGPESPTSGRYPVLSELSTWQRGGSYNPAPGGEFGRVAGGWGTRC